MYKRILVGIGIAGILVVSGAGLAQPVAALTVDEIQVQIKVLLAKVAELQLQLTGAVSVQTTADPTTASTPPQHRVCNILARNLSQGTQGDDVRGLQEFLSAEGYLAVNATGYFGPMTAQAVAKWQSSEGVSAVGAFGPVSRERIKVWCGDKARFAATPQRGLASLDVTFKAMVGGYTPNQYFVDFGDGSARAQVSCYAPTDYCIRPGTVNHTYTQDGTYTAALYEYDPGGCGPNADPRCLGAPARESVLAKEQIYVGPIACTKEYSPECGAKPIVCITTPCNPIQQTYGNRCMMNADGARFLYEGQCRSDYKNPADDLQCRKWFDGYGECRRDNAGGPVSHCVSWLANYSGPRGQAYCKEYFDSSGNNPPVISGLKGPTTLTLNEQGTWTVQASDPENGSLSYSVTWGDENYFPAPMASSAMREAFVQTTTFTHAYSSAGTYTISIVVRDASGKEAKSSSSVRVGDIVANCTMEYAPVCGARPWTCNAPAGASCNQPPQSALETTYSNRCMMNAAGATFIRSGRCEDVVACTMDAMQCPNGTYVGRTGPNCQFVCL